VNRYTTIATVEDILQSRRSIAKAVTEYQMRNIRHDVAEVAKGEIPFQGEDQLDYFVASFQTSLESEEYPDGFELDAEYESSESYKTGRSTKPLVIPLPHNIWFPRIVVWCKALNCLGLLSVATGT
jgi:hypothetical protein